MRLTILFSTTLVSVCTAFASASNNRFQLKYFDARGAAETIRIILALGGDDDDDYDDLRYEITPGTMDSPTFQEAKTNGDLMMNLDRAPVLITPEGDTIGQSKAIERFLARRYGLMGSTDVEAAHIDCVVEHCQDVKAAQMRKRFSPFAKDRSDEEKEADKKVWFEEEMPSMLSKIERTIQSTGEEGFAVGNSISLADLAIFALLSDCFPVYKEATQKAAESCPALLAIVSSVEANPKVAKWLESRTPSNF